ncbi:MAG: LysR family transcriptional regulator [Alphaproteobacteria bacterium]
MKQINTNWSDYLYFLKIAEFRNLQQAADALNVNSSTVYRRLNALEERLNISLFERTRSNAGYSLTFHGEQMLERLAGVEDLFLDTESHFSEGVIPLSGHVIVAATDNLGDTWLLPHIIAFKEKYPQIVIEIIYINHPQVSCYDKADVVFSLANRPSEYMKGQKLQDIRLQLYAHKELIEKAKKMGLSQEYLWQEVGFILPTSQLRKFAVTRWLHSWVDPKAVKVEANEFSALYEYCTKKFGIAVLPEYMVTQSKDLIQVMKAPAELATGLWMLTHTQAQKSACSRVFQEFILERLAEE